MPAELSAPPLQSPIVELSRAPGTFPGQMTKTFADWLRSLVGRSQSSAYAVVTQPLTTLSASIGLTSLIPTASGLFRVSYRFRITTAAAVSSSLQVTITTTEGAVTCNYASPAYTGNVTNAPQTGTFVVRCDASTPLAYSTSYASNPGAAMVYDLDLLVEAL